MLEAGNGLGVIGPSGSGKSSLIRALVGVWQPARGKVRLDAAAAPTGSASRPLIAEIFANRPDEQRVPRQATGGAAASTEKASWQ